MVRDVWCIANISVLITGNERRFNLIREKGIERLIKEDKVKTRFGWIQDPGGVIRYCMELFDDAEIEMQCISLRTVRAPSLEYERRGADSSALFPDAPLLGSR
jgi:hypothetical protein